MIRRRTAIMISGRGSNMAALIEAAKAPDYPAEIALVLSNRPGAGGLDIARAQGIRAEALDYRGFGGRAGFDAAVTEMFEAAGIELVCLAGFMRLLTDGFVTRWRDRLINIHPSLLPAFPGLDTHARALARGVKFAGCTVHFVRPEMDTGPIIAQAAVPVADDDTAETLAARVLAEEHKLYPHALRLVAAGEARIVGDRVIPGIDYELPRPVVMPPEA